MDTEFKSIPEYPDYSINALGVIKRASRTFLNRGHLEHRKERFIRSQSHHKYGHAVTLRDAQGKNHFVCVSRLLLELFGEKRQIYGTIELVAGHKDSDKYNIALDNLQWMTKSEVRKLAFLNKGK